MLGENHPLTRGSIRDIHGGFIILLWWTLSGPDVAKIRRRKLPTFMASIHPSMYKLKMFNVLWWNGGGEGRGGFWSIYLCENGCLSVRLGLLPCFDITSVLIFWFCSDFPPRFEVYRFCFFVWIFFRIIKMEISENSNVSSTSGNRSQQNHLHRWQTTSRMTSAPIQIPKISKQCPATSSVYSQHGTNSHTFYSWSLR